MELFSVRDVERVLQLPRSTLHGLVRHGFVRPARGPRGKFLFSFQDLIVLRAARALIQANIPRQRIQRSLTQLRRHLPETVPMSGLAICAIGDRVVVREGTHHWQADDGQYLLGLDVSVQNGTLQMIEHRRAQTAEKGEADRSASADDLFAEGLRLEESDRGAAIRAYARCAETDPGNAAAWVNWGRLLHEGGDARAAEKVYRHALECCGTDALLHFNRGVALEDLGEADAAMDAYHAALSDDPDLADCHYNLARIYESLGKTQHAIRHLGQYRRLTRRGKH